MKHSDAGWSDCWVGGWVGVRGWVGVGRDAEVHARNSGYKLRLNYMYTYLDLLNNVYISIK